MASQVMKAVVVFGLCWVSASASILGRGFAPQDIITRDVVILGGGATGSYAAVRLKEDFKKSVIVVEKTARLGGHTETYVDPVTGYPVDYGVEAWQNNTAVTNFFKRFNVTLISAPVPPFATDYLDFKTGKTIGYVPPNATALQAALITYLGVIQQYPYLAVGYDLPTAIPEDLLLPFGDFVTKHNIQAAVPTIWTFSQSVGDLLKTPAIYVIQEFGITQLNALFRNGYLIPENHFNSEVYLKAAALLGSDVLYGSTAINVARHNTSLQQLIVQTPTGPKLIKAKKILVTIPPTKDNMTPFSLNHHESELFNQWQTTTYYTGIIRNGIPDNINIINTQSASALNIPIPPYVQGYSYKGVPGLHTFHTISLTAQSASEVSNLILSELKSLAAAGTFPDSATPATIEVLSNHSPLALRVSAEAIREGFYKKLHDLQGLKGTWYTGSAWASDYTAVLWLFTDELLPSIVAAVDAYVAS